MKSTFLDEKTGFLKFDRLLSHEDCMGFRKNTSCHNSAETIRDFLFSNKISAKEEFKNSTCKETLPNIITELFHETKSKNEHTFFYFQNSKPSHTFIIQKKWNGTQFLFRIHKSWVNEFTLGQWEGVDEWPDTPFTKKEIFNKYRGKDLNLSEIKNFFDDINEISTNENLWTQFGSGSDSKPSRCIVTKYHLSADKLKGFDRNRQLKSSVKSLIDQEITRLNTKYKGASPIANDRIATLEKFKTPNPYHSPFVDLPGFLFLYSLKDLKEQMKPTCLFFKRYRTSTTADKINNLILEFENSN